jgi:hypothetical protein
MGLNMEILLGIGIFFLIVGLVVWRLRVSQELEERRIWAAHTERQYNEPWPWPKNKDNI